MSAKNRSTRHSARQAGSNRAATSLRIIGGRLRGRLIRYDGNPATRPMKDRVREAVFNLVGPAVRDRRVIDLFAGTGAMGLEALSRGAAHATLVERRFPSARVISENAVELGLGDQVEVVAGDVFAWIRRPIDLGPNPWLVFICPPYEIFVARCQEMLQMVTDLIERAPISSLLVVESDARFDTQQLPQPERWDVRRYQPTVVSVFESSVRR